MKRWLLSVIFLPIYLLITFFGLGPVLLADGSAGERTLTFVAVLSLYLVTTLVLRRLLKRQQDGQN